MASRFRWVTIAIGLHACFLAGCLHTATSPVAPPVVDLNVRGNTRSPYHEIRFDDRKPLGNPITELVDPEIKRTSQPAGDKPTAPEAPGDPQTTQSTPPTLPPTLSVVPERTPETVTTNTVKEPPDSALLAALRNVLNKKPSEAIDLLQGYDKQTQEILLALLPVAARLSEGGLDHAPAQEIAALIDQLNSLANLLRGRTALTLEKPCFSRKIEGFGLYDPLPANPIFQAGMDGEHGDRVQIYSEVRNFSSRFDGKIHQIHLTGRLEIYDSYGKRLFVRGFRDEPVRSLSPRQDFFVSFRFYLPRGLPPGNYILGVEVRDETMPEAAPRIARCNLPFRITDASTARLDER